MASQQPFQCSICLSRFTRNENLKRHAALHSSSHVEASLPCGSCNAVFSRSDLRQRHLKRKHPEQVEGPTPKRRQRETEAPITWNGPTRSLPAKIASVSPVGGQEALEPPGASDEEGPENDCSPWQTALSCEQPPPDPDYQDHHQESLHHTISASTLADDDGPLMRQSLSMSDSTYSSHFEPDAIDLEQSLLLGTSFLKPTHDIDAPTRLVQTTPAGSFGTNPASGHFNQQIPSTLTPTSLECLREDWCPSNSQTARGVDLYFTHISPFVPFLHRPTFDVASATPHLLLSMLCLAYQHGEDPDTGDRVDSGMGLSTRCFHLARALLAAGEDESAEAWTRDVSVIQAYLLLQICAMMYLCGKDSSYGLQMHSKLIFLARSSGLMQPPPVDKAATDDLESMWREFVRAESRKRTLFAVHQIDALWYQFLSIPRSLSHLEIKHALPCPEDYWAASSATQWAHRQLRALRSAPLVPYTQAVRRFLSRDLDVSSMQAFDPYGAINIAQFLISSAREITGWSAMTGQLSIERFEPLRSSLAALHPFICPTTADAEVPATRTTHSTLCEATWETAMIELQMWSLSHTGGIVEGSVDAMLRQSTYQTPSCEFLVETNTAKAIQPHVDWFLHYLDATRGTELDSEPPWVVLYAYKAFLIAWRLVCGGLSGAMQIVGVCDGDASGALAWARKVFHRRHSRQLGKLIMGCLDVLDAQLQN